MIWRVVLVSGHGLFQRKLTSRTLGSNPLEKKKQAIPIKLHRLKK